MCCQGKAGLPCFCLACYVKGGLSPQPEHSNTSHINRGVHRDPKTVPPLENVYLPAPLTSNKEAMVGEEMVCPSVSKSPKETQSAQAKPKRGSWSWVVQTYFICFTMVLLPDSPAPGKRNNGCIHEAVITDMEIKSRLSHDIQSVSPLVLESSLKTVFCI